MIIKIIRFTLNHLPEFLENILSKTEKYYTFDETDSNILCVLIIVCFMCNEPVM